MVEGKKQQWLGLHASSAFFHMTSEKSCHHTPSNKRFMKYDNKYKSQYLNANQRFMSKSVLKLKKQLLPQIKRVLIPLINLLYVDDCKLCSFKDLSKSDNDSHNQMKTGKWSCSDHNHKRSREKVSLSTNLFGYPGFTRSTRHHSNKGKHKGCLCS